MIKVRCINNYNVESLLDEGLVYEVKYETDLYYFMAHDDDRNWLKSRFEIVKDEEQMTHRQKMKELLPIIQAYCDGAEVEYCSEYSNIWYDWKETFFNSIYQYRIKQTPDTIDWSHVHKDVVSMERHRNGLLRFRLSNGQYFDTIQEAFSSYKQGTVSWEDSLVERPEGV